jgi:hypothetical protein
MTMEPVESSNLKEVGYDPDTQVLRVKFHNGGLYEFDGVSEEKHAALMAADSKGRHFMTHIRHHHEYRRIE